MLSLLKLPIVIISYDFVVSGLAASPGAGLCCTSEDSPAISNLFEVVDEPACFVFLIGMIEQKVLDLLKVACFANVENHNLSRPSIKISSAVNFRCPLAQLVFVSDDFGVSHVLCPFSNGLRPMCFPSLSIVY